MITASIVTYKNQLPVLKEAMQSFLCSEVEVPLHLFIVDNSPTDQIRQLCHDPRITYIFNNKNLGFGAAHNIAMRRVIAQTGYHVVLNPDVYFDKQAIAQLYHFMEANPDVGHCMPRILYPDGSLQYLCKLLPDPGDLILRRFMGFNKSWQQKNNERYELRWTGYLNTMEVPYLSGCFMFLRNSALQKAGLFDERIFMYIEDADLTRRIHQQCRTVFYPEATVYHHYAKGSYKNFRLMLYNIHGAVIYFNKWGWFFDAERRRINREITAKAAQ